MMFRKRHKCGCGFPARPERQRPAEASVALSPVSAIRFTIPTGLIYPLPCINLFASRFRCHVLPWSPCACSPPPPPPNARWKNSTAASSPFAAARRRFVSAGGCWQRTRPIPASTSCALPTARRRGGFIPFGRGVDPRREKHRLHVLRQCRPQRRFCPDENAS